MKEYFFNYYRNNRGVNDLAPFFNSQQPLWDKLEATGVNPLKKYGINVLTMRLLLAQDALTQLKDHELATKRKGGQYVMPSAAQMTASGVQNVVLHPDPGTGWSGEVITIDTIRAHEYFYSLTSSLVSVLDRLANEINDTYKLRIKKVDWVSLCRKTSALKLQNLALSSIIDAANADPLKERLFEYRNVIEHEGVVRIAEVQPLNDIIVIDADYAITVQDDPRDSRSPANTKLVEISKQFFSFVIKACDDVYKAML